MWAIGTGTTVTAHMDTRCNNYGGIIIRQRHAAVEADGALMATNKNHKWRLPIPLEIYTINQKWQPTKLTSTTAIVQWLAHTLVRPCMSSRPLFPSCFRQQIELSVSGIRGCQFPLKYTYTNQKRQPPKLTHITAIVQWLAHIFVPPCTSSRSLSPSRFKQQMELSVG